ncbi:MAG: PP2C family protein-serine/threonine phosphatase [Nocardioides sp.]|nr:PP2C family protein-serine/threonine phosphatase [Nocardioides sp.]
MTATYDAARPARAPRWRRSWQLFRRRGPSTEFQVAVWLGLAGVLITVSVGLWPTQMPFTALMLPLLVASVLLGPRTLPWFVTFLMVLLAVTAVFQVEVTSRTIAATVVQFAMGMVVLAASMRRSALGVAGMRGETMFIDLRDRILDQGGIPDLPPGWQVQSALRTAGGTPFAGDFVVAARRGDHLEVVVVDVSGKGEEAGTRALMLSGAFGGLLGAMPPQRFLPAANDYLLRQDWDEGFATAVHLSLVLTTGDYEIRTAGHPPAAHRTASSGRWQVLRTEGPVLGLIEDATFTCATGHLGKGDAVILYTDGMVEEPRRDIELGIDRMLGQAESLLRGSFDGAATRLTEALGSPDDDRAMLVVHRP